MRERTDLYVRSEENRRRDYTRRKSKKTPGEEGKVMLDRMNHSHYEVTGWALAHWKIKGDDQILDIGCGGGRSLHRMTEQFDDWIMRLVWIILVCLLKKPENLMKRS